MFRLSLLGGAALECDGRVVTGPAARKHPLALLALLSAGETRSLSRSRLVGYLWPESAETVARNRLTTCVYNLRRALGAETVISAGEDLRLDHERLPSDVQDFWEAIRAGDRKGAVHAYRGSFLDGFHLPGAPEFEHWVDRERERLRLRYVDALRELAAGAERSGEPGEAVRWWQMAHGEDPLDSAGTFGLMSALDRVGNRAGALRVARDHEALLEREFGTRPRPEVEELVGRLRSGDEAPSGHARERLAVLPFATLGEEPVPGFTDGVHGDLLNRLSGLGDVAVISRGSVMRYRDDAVRPDVIRRELGADWALQGSVRVLPSRIRVDARLTDLRDDRQVWGESYQAEPTADDLFDVQAGIAERIATALAARLTPAERSAVARNPTDDLEAHRLYVQGRGHLDERTEEGLLEAMGHFQAAIRRDPAYALAWSGLADAGSFLHFYAFRHPPAVPAPAEAVRRALEADPLCGEAHASLGIQKALGGDGPGARSALERAIELRPSHGEAYAWLGWVLLMSGRPFEALEPALRAVEIDPLAPAYRAYLAEVRLATGQADQALADARRAVGIQPGYGLARFMEALVLQHLGRHDEARAALEGVLDAIPTGGSPRHDEVRALAAVAASAQGGMHALRDALAALDVRDAPFSVGFLRAALGDVDGSFEAFDRVRSWSAFEVEYLRYFFPEILGGVRADARFRDLLRRIDEVWR